MPFDPARHHRRSIRLKGYDYARAGAYFVTVCIYRRECLLGDVLNGEMVLNAYGRIIWDEWFRSVEIRHEIELDEFVAMPNHIHGIVIIHDGNAVGATGRSPLQPPRGPSKRSLGAFMAGFGSAITKRINQMRHTPGVPFWQRNYHEHIIRDEKSLNNIRRYIRANPMMWAYDTENPDRRERIPKQVGRTDP